MPSLRTCAGAAAARTTVGAVHRLAWPAQRCVTRAARCISCSASGSASANADGDGSSGPGEDAQAESRSREASGPLSWLRRALGGGGKLDKQRMAEYGLGAFAAYGILSNLNAGVLLTIAWLAVVKQTGGMTPLDPGQWPRFLAVYAGLYITTNLLRPVRLTLALTAAPLINRALDGLQRGLRISKGAAFVLLLLCIAVTSLAGITTAIAVCGGFPNGLPRLLTWKG